MNNTFCYVLILLIYCIYDIRSARRNMESNVVGGENTTISEFPHSAGLKISCINKTLLARETCICNGAIVNHKILLTVAHCFDGCEDMLPRSDRVRIDITLGSTYLKNTNYKGATYITHDQYDPVNIECDIALILVSKSIALGDNIKRILVPRQFPTVKFGYVAGWGVINEETGEMSPTLKKVSQEIVTDHLCQGYLRIPAGTICTRLFSKSHVDSGDSGSALVVKNFIAVGLVSYKHRRIHDPVIVYTALPDYYTWIKENAMKLYCRGRRRE